jgi:hypothetical protein
LLRGDLQLNTLDGDLLVALNTMEASIDFVIRMAQNVKDSDSFQV